jgi:hypothetical protein
MPVYCSKSFCWTCLAYKFMDRCRRGSFNWFGNSPCFNRCAIRSSFSFHLASNQSPKAFSSTGISIQIIRDDILSKVPDIGNLLTWMLIVIPWRNISGTSGGWYCLPSLYTMVKSYTAGTTSRRPWMVAVNPFLRGSKTLFSTGRSFFFANSIWNMF